MSEMFYNKRRPERVLRQTTMSAPSLHKGAGFFRSGSLLLAVALFLFALFLPGSAAADEIKKNIFKDCQAALDELPALTADGRRDLLSYLSRVVNMQSGSKDELIAEQNPNLAPAAGGNPLTEPLQPITLWRIFEPTRELEAKKCAVELLKRLSPESLPAVPELISLAAAQKVSPALARAFNEAAWTIVLDSKRQNALDTPEDFFPQLMSEYLMRKSYIAADILVELHDRSLPWIIEEFKNSSDRKRSRLTRLIAQIDDQGYIVGPALVSLLDAGDDELRYRALQLYRNLPAYYKDLLPRLLRRLADPSYRVREELYRVLAAVFACPAAVSGVDQELVSAMLREFKGASAEQRAVIEQGLKMLGRDSSLVREKLIEFAKAEDETLRSKAVNLLGELQFEDDDVQTLFFEALYDPAVSVRASALHALAMNPNPALGSHLTTFLKSVTRQRESYPKEILIVRAAEAAATLPKDRTLERMIPYFVDALAYREPELAAAESNAEPLMTEASNALIHAGRPAVAPTIKALRKSDPLTKKRAVWVLVNITPVEKNTVEQIASLLKDRQLAVRQTAGRALSRLGDKAVVEAAEKTLRGAEQQAAGAAARLLFLLGRRDPRMQSVLLAEFKTESCRHKQRLAQQLLEFPGLDNDALEGELMNCVVQDGQLRNEFLSLLKKFVPLAPDSLTRLKSLMTEAAVSPDAKLEIAAAAGDLGVPREETAAASISLLQAGDNSVKNRAIPLLARYGSAKQEEALRALKEIIDDEAKENPLRCKAAAAIAEINPAGFDYQDFFIKELKSARHETAEEALRMIKPERAVPLLVRALKDAPPDKRYIPVAALGGFAEGAKGAANDIAALLNDDDELLRYEAALALLKIDPQRPESLPALRRELVGRYQEKLLKAGPPEGVKPLLEDIARDSESFLERRNARELLQKNEPAERKC